jgi:CRISPR/Cas system CSM-associated protein Csm4 (group 5 of RAMP superfamily)
MIQKFSIQDVEKVIKDFSKKKEDEIIAAFEYLGFEYVNRSRIGGSYQDRTGNLRSSIGFIVLKDGSIVKRHFEGKEAEGVQSQQTAAEEIATEFSNGIYLVVFAGMHYAIYVEAKGFSVLSSFMPGRDEFLESLKDLTEKSEN